MPNEKVNVEKQARDDGGQSSAADVGMRICKWIDLVYEFDRQKLNMSVKVLCPLSAISMIIILFIL